jgi:hypothetical protein
MGTANNRCALKVERAVTRVASDGEVGWRPFQSLNSEQVAGRVSHIITQDYRVYSHGGHDTLQRFTTLLFSCLQMFVWLY